MGVTRLHKRQINVYKPGNEGSNGVLMESLTEWIQSNKWRMIVGGLSGLIIVLASPFWTEARTIAVREVFGKLSNTALQSLSASLLLSCLVLVAWLSLFTNRRRTIKQYEPDPESPSVWRHRSRHYERVCPRCVVAGQYSPMFPKIGERTVCVAKGCGFWSDPPNGDIKPQVYSGGGM
jgi:hypothetical protein